jgi:hypothetical protein
MVFKSRSRNSFLVVVVSVKARNFSALEIKHYSTVPAHNYQS